MKKLIRINKKKIIKEIDRTMRIRRIEDTLKKSFPEFCNSYQI